MSKIMIVEDDLATAFTIKMIIREMGIFEAVGTEYAEDVKELEITNHYSLIIMDIMLSGEMNGLQAAKDLRKRDRMVPIIFISALTDSETRLKIKRISNSEHISKPFDIDILGDRIRSYHSF